MSRQFALPALCLVLLTAGLFLALREPSAAGATATLVPEKDERIFEIRTYTTAPGRLDVLHKRFREHTNYLFVKHGMSLIGYWTPTDQPETLVYILAYPSLEAREKSWNAFMNDPDWKKAWADSKKDGPVVTKVEKQFLRATDYSPIR